MSINKVYKKLEGQKFGQLTAIKEVRKKGEPKKWLCLCDCGREKEIIEKNLIRGGSKTCGAGVHIVASKNGFFKGCGDIGLWYFNQCLAGAISRNLEFSITIEQIWDLFLKQNRKCALSGKELKITSCKIKGNASLDRIDSSKGYTLNNVQWVTKEINQMKSNLDEKYFLQICKEIANHVSVQKEKSEHIQKRGI